jgi:hypothetical protein
MGAVGAHDSDLNETEESDDDPDPDQYRHHTDGKSACSSNQQDRKEDQVKVNQVSRAKMTLDGTGH